MTIRKPPGKRLASLLLSLALLLTLVPAMGTTARAANAAPSKVAVTINGTSISLDSGDYVETNSSSTVKSSASTEPTGYVAWYYDGVLTLNGYAGGKIRTGNTDPADTTIKLKGTNKVTVNNTAYSSSSEGILHDGGGNLTITGDSGSTLKIDVAGGGNVYAIVTNYSAVGRSDGTVTIGGSAKVSILAQTAATSGAAAYGIYVPGGVTIREDASLDVTCETNCSSQIADNAPKMGAGIITSADGTKSLTIDTSGSVRLDFSKADNAYSTYALQTPKVILNRGRLEMFWRLTTSADPYGSSVTAVSSGTEAGTYAAREKKDVDGKKGAAVFVKGTPHTLKLVNALDADWSVNSDNEVQYVAGETVTLKPVSITKDFHTGWKSADGVSISGDTFTMPDKGVTVEGLYNVFAQQPGFKRTHESASNTEGTITFKLNGSPTNTRTALVRETGDDFALFLYASASVENGEWKYTAYNNETANGVLPGQYRVRVEYGNYTFYSDVFTVKYAAPSAYVAEENAVTVSGSAGTAIDETPVTVTLASNTFASALSGEWITNLPAGLSQSVTRTGDTTATITISGTPQVGSNADMVITIPAGALAEEKETSVNVFVNSKAKFNITSNAPTAENIQIGDGSNNKFSEDALYYKNGENGAKGTFSNDSSNWNAYYNPATGTLTLKNYDGPYIKINGTSSEQTVTVKLEGNNKAKSEWDHAIWLVGGVNLIVTAGTEASLALTGGTDYCGIGNANAGDVGSVTISGKANVTINASAAQYMTAYGILSGKDVTIEKNASLSVNCTKTVDTSVTAYGIMASGKVTVDTTGTVNIDVSGCGRNDTTFCIQAGSIAFKNAEAITLKYVPAFDWSTPTSPSDPTRDTFDASGMKTPTTATDSESGVTTVTYAKKGAQPAPPTISAVRFTEINTSLDVTLTCADSDAKIYYTMDGSDPRDSSSSSTRKEYRESFSVEKICTVKAVAYSAEDEQYSDVTEQEFRWKAREVKVENGNAYSDAERSTWTSSAEPESTVYLKAEQTKTIGGVEQVFSGWTVEKGDMSIENSGSCNDAYFIMPYKPVTVKANYIDKSAGVTVSGTAVSWNNKDNAEYYLYPTTMSDADIRAQWKTGGTVSGYYNEYTVTKGSITANADGKRYDQTFSFSTVPAGTYKLVIFKPDKYVPKIVKITVGTSDYSCGELKLWLYGDVNYDGAVNGTDATQALRYFNGKTPNAFISSTRICNTRSTHAPPLLCWKCSPCMTRAQR